MKNPVLVYVLSLFFALSDNIIGVLNGIDFIVVDVTGSKYFALFSKRAWFIYLNGTISSASSSFF